MDSEDIKDDKPLPHGVSQWDKLPNELKDMVFKHASLLTQFVNGRLKLKPKEDVKTHHLLWKEVFDVDWAGDLELLPVYDIDDPCFILKNVDLARVKSRFMYERLCARFPEATETNGKFAETDEEIELYNKTDNSADSQEEGPYLENSLRLLHVPMRHMWLDLLGETLDTLPYARANDCIIQGHTDLLRHLVDMGRVDLKRIRRVCTSDYDSFSINAIDVAAELGHLDIIKMFHEAGCQEVSTEAMDGAAANGHLDVVKWLHENCTEGCTNRAIDWAAMNRHLDVVKWLHENRTERCTVAAMDNAAEKGHLDVVKWLHENCSEGCTTKAMDNAARNGHLEVVKFLHEKRTEGCTKYAMDAAAYHGYLDVVKWLHENRNEGCTHSAMDWAARHGHLDIVKFLHENRSEGCTVDAMDGVALSAHLCVIKWLHENRTEGCTTEAMDRAASHGHLEIVKFLHENRTEGGTTDAIDHAVQNGYHEVVRFLLDNRSEGFSDDVLRDCTDMEMSGMLVASMQLERRRRLLKTAISENWDESKTELLKEPLDGHEEQ